MLVIPMIGLLASCSSSSKPSTIVTDGVVISVPDQKLALFYRGNIVKSYDVSTSKFGVGDTRGSCRTPLGLHRVAAKIGDRQPQGMVFKNRRPTGELVAPNAPGRDPIVTRIIRLQGLEYRNRNAFARNIYIHGTPEERKIGRPASYGCIRMKSRDITEIYPYVWLGAPVSVERCSLTASAKAAEEYLTARGMYRPLAQTSSKKKEKKVIRLTKAEQPSQVQDKSLVDNSSSEGWDRI